MDHRLMDRQSIHDACPTSEICVLPRLNYVYSLSRRPKQKRAYNITEKLSFNIRFQSEARIAEDIAFSEQRRDLVAGIHSKHCYGEINKLV